MYLKQVELIGFKSFYEKTKMEFAPGITVIVGPNGCGKSNLVDAIRWALGEQSSKSLRGGRMEEIIFSGTQERKPLNFAEVSLTFGDVGASLNLDYEEVTVTRRLYHSGESEYLLNKAPCRLKDITGLFLDTGVGKDFYSIIGQGRVEEIVNSRPEERREIFEEAAGILKYKRRKKEAQRRLDETGENMDRVQDLISELEYQVEPLKEQAEVAGEYRLLQEQIDAAKKKLLAYQVWFYGKECKQVETKLLRSDTAVASAVAEGGRREKQLLELRQRLQEETGLLRKEEQDLNRQMRELEQVEGKLQLLAERNVHYREQLQELADQCQDRLKEAGKLTALSRELGEEIKEKRRAAVKEQDRRHRLEEELKQFEEGSLMKGLEQQQQALLQVTSDYNAAEAAVKELGLQLEREEKRGAVFQREEEGINRELNDTISRQEELKSSLVISRRKVADLKNSRRKGLERLDELTGQLERTRKIVQGDREELRALDSRIRVLKEQEADLSGYYRGVKGVIQASRGDRATLTGIVGPLVDLITVEEKYLRAVEEALGGGLQSIVAATGEAAKKAIGFLKQNNLGRATFLPLDMITVYPSGLDRHSQWRGREGVLGRLAAFVKVEPVYRRVIDYLLGNVVLCRDLEAAVGAARAIKYSCRVITLEGEVINPGGSMRGGSLPKRSAGLLGRRHEIDTLQKNRDRLEQKLLKVSREMERLQEKILAFKATREETIRLLEEEQERLIQLVKLEDQLAQRRLHGEERLKTLVSSREEYRRERAALTGRLRVAGQQVQDYKQMLVRVRQALEGEKGLYEEGLARKEELEKKLTGSLLKLNSLQEQEHSLQEKLARINGERERLEGEVKKLRVREEKIARALENNQAEEGELRRLQREQGALLATATERVEKLQEEVRTRGLRLAELEAGDQKWLKRRQRLERRKQKLGLEQARLQAELKLWRLRYSEQFGEGEPEAPEIKLNPAQVEKEIEELQEQQGALGEVNLGAIDELKRLEERIEFLQRQVEDLREGEQSILSVLAEIDRHMARYFTRTLELINQNFLTVFKDLFGGGKAYLELTDPDHLLDSGVEIVAQPPGKRLQSITLLSTGEKVLTALALIFAILLHKPAPFYLLDEVESALDEVNLSKFTDYLQKLSDQAQFILITHRRQTMDTAGIIYGVTMPEPGISKLVSVKIDEKAG